MRLNWILFSLILIFVALIPKAHAGKVYKVKDSSVYIKLSTQESENLAEGDKVFLLDENKKKKGLAIIKKLKGKKAKAELTKGKAEKGFKTKSKSGSTEKMTKLENTEAPNYEENANDKDVYSGDSSFKFALLGGYSIAGQDVLQEGTVTQTTTTKGSSMSLRGMIDYPLFSNFSIMAGAGFEKWGVTGNGINVDDGSPLAAQTDIMYLSMDFWGRVDLIDIGVKVFALGGGGLYLPMSKSSNIIAADSIATTGLFMVGGGLRYPMGSMEIMISGDYYIFQTSETVKTSMMGAKFGVLFSL